MSSHRSLSSSCFSARDFATVCSCCWASRKGPSHKKTLCALASARENPFCRDLQELCSNCHFQCFASSVVVFKCSLVYTTYVFQSKILKCGFPIYCSRLGRHQSTTISFNARDLSEEVQRSQQRSCGCLPERFLELRHLGTLIACLPDDNQDMKLEAPLCIFSLT